jgi:serine/threonine protein kinase
VRTSTDELRRGDSLGRYEIIERVATGGMAEIYLGRVRGTAGFDKLVAIKRILPHVAMDQAFVEMFLAEARLAATLRHPNIADVFDVGIVKGSYFFAMEFIHGQDLRAIQQKTAQRHGRMPLEIAVAIVSNIASALAYAHKRTGPNGPLHLVHRDVSPSNILVSYDGAVKLVDFGIARAESNTTTTVTRTGQIKGKIPYMSPEQCRAKTIDARADLFSLGIVLYELTTNVRPFDGKGDFDTLERIVHGILLPPSEVVPDYPRALEAIVMRLLANKRSARYQSGDAVVADLERLATTHDLFASAFMVGKWLRELFPAEASTLPHVEHERRTEAPTTLGTDVDVDIAEAGSGVYPFDAPTGKFEPLSERRTPPGAKLEVVFRAPRQTPDQPVPATVPFDKIEQSPFLDEGSSLHGEVTHSDPYPPFDPIAMRSAQILAGVGGELGEDRELSLQTMSELLQRAATWSDARDLESAVIALELVLSADRKAPGVLDMLAKNFPFMTAVFEAYLGDRSRMPALSRQIEELSELRLDQRAAYLLSQITGTMSAAELIERADMPVLEAYRHLSQLILRRVVVLV